MLPKVNIGFDNGTIGAVTPSSDGIFAVLASAVATTNFSLGEGYKVKSMKDVAKLGIIDTIDNHRLYKFLSEYFAEGGSGNELWIMGFAKDQTLASWFTPDTTGVAPAEKILNLAKGKIKAVFTCYDGAVPDTPSPYDWSPELQLMQTFASNYTQKKYAPIFVITEWYDFNGDVIALPDLLTYDHNRVGVLIGDTEQRTIGVPSKGAAMGILAGRLARLQVHQNVGKPKDGSTIADNVYIVDTPAELFDVESLHDKGYMTFRTHTNKSGYYFTHGILATDIDDDYRHITRRRVIDKAFSITYDVLVDELLSEVPVTNQGTVSPVYAKTLEGQIANKIYNQMTVNNELSFDQSDKNDKGCLVVVNTTNNFLASSTVEVTIRIKPYGYNEFVDVKLGYDTKNN